MSKNQTMLLLTICCLIGGYGFYKVNNDDLISAVGFTVGILGIMLSVIRNKKK